MKTLIIMFKEYDKNIVFRDCQMHILNIRLRRNAILLIFFRHIVERQLCMGDWPSACSLSLQHFF